MPVRDGTLCRPPLRARADIAVVTDASGGLGRALSIAFTHAGVRVVGLARSAARLRETGALCAPDRFTGIVADVSDAARIRAAFAQMEAEIGQITILVNNAAACPRVDVLSAPAERILEQIEINLNGYINCAMAALQVMGERGEGRIINVSSFPDDTPIPGGLGHSVSAAAGRAFAAALAAETAERLPGIVVSEWIPGIPGRSMGRADGISPDIAAQWGVSLALATAPGLHGVTFLGDRRFVASRGWRRRLSDRVLRVSWQPFLRSCSFGLFIVAL